MNKHYAIWIVTGALALGLSACLWESEQDGGGTTGGTGSTGGGGTGFTGGGNGTGSTGGVFFLQRSADGGIASDEPEDSSNDTSSSDD